MSRIAALAFGLVLAAGCSKKGADAPPKKDVATVTTGTVGSDGVRTVPVAVDDKGYSPETIPGKPNEKLKLVFTRTFESECISELKTPEGKIVPLPMNKPVEVAVTVPASGELAFACGMDMFHGKIVAQGG